jgi:hypothetical protein
VKQHGSRNTKKGKAWVEIVKRIRWKAEALEKKKEKREWGGVSQCFVRNGEPIDGLQTEGERRAEKERYKKCILGGELPGRSSDRGREKSIERDI